MLNMKNHTKFYFHLIVATIHLPIENVPVSIRYNNTSKLPNNNTKCKIIKHSASCTTQGIGDNFP